MQVLVTGAPGFLGSHVARLCVARGDRVRALARSTSDRSALAGIDVEWIVGDVTAPETLGPAVAGCERVFHLAADLSFFRKDAARQRAVNVEGTRNLLRAALGAGVARVIHTSSVAAVGVPPAGTVGNEGLPFNWPPGLSYMETKRDAELECQKAVLDGLDVVIVNPAVVAGPDEITRKWAPMLKALARRLVPVLPEGGTNLCDVRDVAQGHLGAAERGRRGERYILGGENLTYAALVALYCEALAVAPPRLRLPGALMAAASRALGTVERLGLPLPAPVAYLDVAPLETFYSSDKARRELGYQPRPARETVADAVAWYRAAGLL